MAWRTGVPRLARNFAERGFPVTNMMNAAFPDYYPSCAELALKAGWELSAHGLFQRSLQFEPDEEGRHSGGSGEIRKVLRFTAARVAWARRLRGGVEYARCSQEERH